MENTGVQVLSCSDLWSTILPYLDSFTLQHLASVNKWFQRTIKDERFTPLYRPIVRVEFRSRFDVHGECSIPVPLRSFMKRVVSCREKKLLLEKLFVKESGLFDKIAFELNFKEEPFKPMDAVVFITKKPCLISLRQLAKLHLISKNAPIVVVNVGRKEVTSAQISTSFPNILVLNILNSTHQQQSKSVEDQVFDYLRRKCQILQTLLYNSQMKHCEIIDNILQMNGNNFRTLINDLSGLYGITAELGARLGMPVSPLMNLISFHQLDLDKQLKLIHKFYHDHLGGTVGMFAYRLTRSVSETKRVMHNSIFNRFDREIYRTTGEHYDQVQVKLLPDSRSFVVKYWKVDTFYEHQCRAMLVTTVIPWDFYSPWDVREENVCSWNAVASTQCCVVS